MMGMKLNKKTIPLLLVSMVCLLFSGIFSAERKETLFPEQDYVTHYSKSFFKKVNLSQPLISNAEFFVRTETYLSAYIYLAIFVVKNDYYGKLIPQIEANHESLIKQLGELKKEIRIENYPSYIVKLNTGKLSFFLSLIALMVRDYNNNALSGEDAFRVWNILFDMITQVYKGKTKDPEDAALLEAATHFIFFKDYVKWDKKASKIMKKIDKTTLTNADVLFILNYN